MTDDLVPTRRPAGSVRTAAIWAVVSRRAQARADELRRPLSVLDVGGGTGGLAVPLALAGHDVLVVDPSPDALASLRRRAGESDAAARVRAVQGDADSLAEVLGATTVDLVTCHGTLEHVDDPQRTLTQLAGALAPGGLLSLVVAQRYAAVLGRALAGSLERAGRALSSPDGRWGTDDPSPRRFDRDALLDLVTTSGLVPDEVHGVRIFADLVPSSALDSEADRQALLALEEAAAAHPALAALGTALHVVAARA